TDARKRKCPVLVAKLDRLSRDVHFISGASLLRCTSPLLALSGLGAVSPSLSAFGAKRTCRDGGSDVNDPQPTKAPSKSRSAVGLPRCYLPLRSTGEIAGETARVHCAAWRRGGCVAARGARPAEQTHAHGFAGLGDGSGTERMDRRLVQRLRELGW